MIVTINWVYVSAIVGGNLGALMVWGTRHKEHLTPCALAALLCFFITAIATWGILDAIETFHEIDKVTAEHKESK